MSSVTEVELGEGRIIRITGPAKVDVVTGRILAVGSKFPAGSSLVIHKFRSYGIKVLTQSKVRITLGEGAKVEEARNGEEVVDEWLRVVEYILRKCAERLCKILVVGPPESGKSTFTAFLANYLREAGVRVGVIDGDVGQEDILIPTTVALTEVTKPILWLRELEPQLFKFVGCISPQYCYPESILAIKELVDEAVKLGFRAIVVNTDGWVGTTSGIEHKLAITRWIKPDIVVVTDREVFDYLSKCIDGLVEVVYTSRPTVARERSREERRELRTQAYRKYFSRGRIRRVKLGSIGILNIRALAGRAIPADEIRKLLEISDSDLSKVAYSSKYGDTVFLVTKEPVDISLNQNEAGKVAVLNLRDLRGAIVGLLGERLSDVGIGVILDADLESQEVTILTPWDGAIRGLVVGKVRLSEDFEEIGRVSKCIL
ncbi:MAG: Clp1/GlmU family protein [Sulfolobales archaeon]|nr:Clp1/GlmU family protein [Sulfolobales archaeon]MCX8208809.1 Clp1/GlmU family protein [Sulfolobales archaeon]MDW8010741.1 Clp1/GlmU family protein [Sulfolobales archaeon]